MAINGKSKALALVSVVTILAIVSGILLVPQIVNATDTEDVTLTTLESDETILSGWNNNCGGFARDGMQFGRGGGFGGFGGIEVSEEFEQMVTDIAESDADVQNLLTEGYNVTSVRPIIKTLVDGEGNVVTKATDALVILENDSNGHASVMVDVEEAKVTQIVILTKTVIEKP